MGEKRGQRFGDVEVDPCVTATIAQHYRQRRKGEGGRPRQTNQMCKNVPHLIHTCMCVSDE